MKLLSDWARYPQTLLSPSSSRPPHLRRVTLTFPWWRQVVPSAEWRCSRREWGGLVSWRRAPGGKGSGTVATEGDLPPQALSSQEGHTLVTTVVWVDLSRWWRDHSLKRAQTPGFVASQSGHCCPQYWAYWVQGMIRVETGGCAGGLDPDLLLSAHPWDSPFILVGSSI